MRRDHFIYLDDIRTPNDEGWIVVRNYDEFVAKITEIGLENIEYISLDHDLGDSAMQEWHTNVANNFHYFKLLSFFVCCTCLQSLLKLNPGHVQFQPALSNLTV